MNRHMPLVSAITLALVPVVLQATTLDPSSGSVVGVYPADQADAMAEAFARVASPPFRPATRPWSSRARRSTSRHPHRPCGFQAHLLLLRGLRVGGVDSRVGRRTAGGPGRVCGPASCAGRACCNVAISSRARGAGLAVEPGATPEFLHPGVGCAQQVEGRQRHGCAGRHYGTRAGTSSPGRRASGPEASVHASGESSPPAGAPAKPDVDASCAARRFRHRVASAG